MSRLSTAGGHTLTADLVRPRLKQHGSSIEVAFVEPTDAHWLRTANELNALFRACIGTSASAWDTALDEYEGERMDYVVIRGLAKVLADAATFSPVDTVLAPADVRERLFAHGPALTDADLFRPHTRAQILDHVADELGVTAQVLELALFADRPTEYVLRAVGPEWTAEVLLIRYNLELARGVLYWVSEMRVEIHDHYKDFWRYVKLFKLMFEAKVRDEGGYVVRLDGPISPFVNSTLRYGRQFAAFLPALFLGEQWRMVADIRRSGSDTPLSYRLDYHSPLTSHFKHSGLFDSRLEADFAAEFKAKFGGKRGQWQLEREDEVLLLGNTVFIPDFSVTHKRDGRRALIEIVGFWHPDYLRRKVEKVRAANLRNLVLLIYEGVNLGTDKLSDVPSQVLYFPNKPVLKDVMAAIEACAS